MSSLTSSYAGALILASMAALGAAYLGNKVAGDSAPAPEPTPLPSLDTPAPLAITDGAAPLAITDGAAPPAITDGSAPLAITGAPDSSVSEEDARRKLLPLVKADGVDAILKFVKTPASQWKTLAPSSFKLTQLVRMSTTHPDKCPAAMIRICAMIFSKYSQMAKASKGEPYDEIGSTWGAFSDLIDELPEPPSEVEEAPGDSAPGSTVPGSTVPAPVVPGAPAPVVPGAPGPAVPGAPGPAVPVVPGAPGPVVPGSTIPAAPAGTAHTPPSGQVLPSERRPFPNEATLDRPWLAGVPSTHGPAIEGPLIGKAPDLAAVPPPEGVEPPSSPRPDISRSSTDDGPPSPAGPDRPWLQPLDARLRGPSEVVPPPAQLRARLNIDQFKIPDDVYEDAPPPPANPPLPAITIANQRGSVLAKSGRNTLGRVQAFVPLTPPDTPPGTPHNELEPRGQLKEQEVRTARPTIGELTNANAEAKATELAAYIKANPSQRASIINEFTSALESAMHAGRVTAATQSAVRTLVGASRRRREG